MKDDYAIPQTEGAKHLTKLNLTSGYYQVDIEDKDKPKTAFQEGILINFDLTKMKQN